ncbi:MAG: universal stress protein [Silvibacterium sp.]|nr:universal stress protein [Silvibacterium sp.]
MLVSLLFIRLRPTEREALRDLETHLLEGDTVDAIMRLLLDHKTDLLVVGLHRHSSHILRLWSRAYEIALDAPCSVLGVH